MHSAKGSLRWASASTTREIYAAPPCSVTVTVTVSPTQEGVRLGGLGRSPASSWQSVDDCVAVRPLVDLDAPRVVRSFASPRLASEAGRPRPLSAGRDRRLLRALPWEGHLRPGLVPRLAVSLSAFLGFLNRETLAGHSRLAPADPPGGTSQSPGSLTFGAIFRIIASFRTHCRDAIPRTSRWPFRLPLRGFCFPLLPERGWWKASDEVSFRRGR